MIRSPLIVLTAAVLAACGSTRHVTDGAPALAPPSTQIAPASATTTTVAQSPSSTHHPPGDTVKRTALQFANAYLLYQIGREPPAVIAAIRRTCTPAFADELLASPVSVPPVQQHNPAYRSATIIQVSYHLAAGAALQIVNVAYRTTRSHRDALQLQIVHTRAGWRVSGVA